MRLLVCLQALRPIHLEPYNRGFQWHILYHFVPTRCRLHVMHDDLPVNVLLRGDLRDRDGPDLF